MDDNERRSFSNLILLCKPHHDQVDKTDPESYPTEMLESWKTEKEAGLEIGAAELTEENLGEALVGFAVETNVVTVAGNLSLGGRGGEAPGAGGGGGGVIGSGSGGPGGPGAPPLTVSDSQRVELAGGASEEPGSGGGGGGYLAPGTIESTLPDSLEGSVVLLGQDGRSGGDTVLMLVGKEILKATGGEGALAGSGQRSRSNHLRVSTLTSCRYVEVSSEGLVHIVSGGFTWHAVLNLGDTLRIAIGTIVEAGSVPEGEYTLRYVLTGPDGATRLEKSYGIAVTKVGDVARLAMTVPLTVSVDAFGVWKVSVCSDEECLAEYKFVMKRSGT